MRKSLLMVRRLWAESSPVRPFCFADRVPGDEYVSRFAYRFVHQSHSRRKAP